MILSGKCFRYFPIFIFMLSEDDDLNFISMWSHVRVILCRLAEHQRDIPGSTLGYELSIFLDRYLFPCFSSAVTVVFICVSVQPCLMVG